MTPDPDTDPRWVLGLFSIVGLSGPKHGAEPDDDAEETSAFTAARAPVPDLDAALAALAEDLPHLD